MKRLPDPWGLEVAAKYLRATKDGVTDAERYLAGVRGTRSLNDRWSVFVGATGERDTFAGFDLRGILEGGATYKLLNGPVHTLSFDGGLTWTKLNPVSGNGRSFVGGILGAAYEWTLSKTSAFTEKVRWYPDFDRTSDWRATSETALKASLTGTLALKAAYEVRYSNQHRFPGSTRPTRPRRSPSSPRSETRGTDGPWTRASPSGARRSRVFQRRKRALTIG